MYNYYCNFQKFKFDRKLIIQMSRTSLVYTLFLVVTLNCMAINSYSFPYNKNVETPYVVNTHMDVEDGSIAEGFTITGMVVDVNSDPLPGVSVMIKGTTQGTATDVNGAFSLSVQNENSTLIFSFIGFTSQEMAIGRQRNFNIILLEDTHQIEEVVVIGYGSLNKRLAGCHFSNSFLSKLSIGSKWR